MSTATIVSVVRSFDDHLTCDPPIKLVRDRPDKPPCPLGLLTVEDFIDCMARTLVYTGESLRSIEARAAAHGGLPRSTLSWILKQSTTLPSEKQLKAFIYACRLAHHWDSWKITRTVIRVIQQPWGWN